MDNENALVVMTPAIEPDPVEIDMSDRMSILHPNLANARQELDRCLCRAIDSTEDGDETKLTLSIIVSAMGMMKLLKYKIDVKTTREIDSGKGSIPNMVYKYDELGRLHAFEPQVSMDDIKTRQQVELDDLTKDVSDEEAQDEDGWAPPAEESAAPEREESGDAPAEEIPEEERSCDNCRDEQNDSRDGPCSACDASFSNWTKKVQE